MKTTHLRGLVWALLPISLIASTCKESAIAVYKDEVYLRNKMELQEIVQICAENLACPIQQTIKHRKDDEVLFQYTGAQGYYDFLISRTEKMEAACLQDANNKFCGQKGNRWEIEFANGKREIRENWISDCFLHHCEQASDPQALQVFAQSFALNATTITSIKFKGTCSDGSILERVMTGDSIPGPNESTTGSNVGLIVGIVVALSLLVGITGIIIYRRRRRRANKVINESSQEIPYEKEENSRYSCESA